MKMEPIVSSETSAIRTQTPGNYPKRNNLHLEHGESLRTKLDPCLLFASCLNTGNLEKTTTIYFSVENTQIFKQLNRQRNISSPLIQNKVVCI